MQLHLVGNAHIDPVWIWDWHEGLHEVLQTFRAAADRLDGDADLIFTASSAAHYEWVEETDPVLFERIRAAVRAGRWVLAGGQWVEPDCNLPAGESVCRQLLYGQRYFMEKFGKTATVGFNVDSFGHAGTLPQLLIKSGLRGYVFMRPQPHEKELPGPVFVWRSADGSTVPAYRIPFNYATPARDEEATIQARAEELVASAEELRLPLMLFFGVGDHGGGPTRRALRAGHRLIGETGGAAGFSDPEQYFAQLADAARNGGVPELPVIDGELQWHAVGCYSARSDIKSANARAEQALLTAERMAELCRALTGMALEASPALASAWRGVLFGQFHDSLGGTCTDEAYAGVFHQFGYAEAVADRITTAATHAVAQQVDTWTEGADGADGMQASLDGMPLPLIVFNSLSWPVTAPLSVGHRVTFATDDRGHRLAVQQIPSGEVTSTPTRSLLQVALPAFGYRRFWLHGRELPSEGDVASRGAPAAIGADGAAVEADGSMLRNGLVCVAVDPATGAVTGLIDQTGRDWVAQPGVLPVVIDDPSDTWSHGVARYEGPEHALRPASVTLVESGPVRATYRVVFPWGRSSVIEEISVYEGQPFVELRFTVDWHETGQLLKLVAPLAIDEPVTAAGAPYGHAPRPPSGHEEVMLHWVDVSERSGGGVACTTDVKYGYDVLGPRLRLTALRSPYVADHGHGWQHADPVGYPVTDQGVQTFAYRLHPHTGGWADAGVARLADEQITAMPFVLDTWHHGMLGASQSALQVETGEVAVSVVKRSEDGHGTVLRVWEIAGRGGDATLSLTAPPRCWTGRFAPHEVRTLFVPDTPDGQIVDIDIPELGLVAGV